MSLSEFDKKYSDKGLGFTSSLSDKLPERLLLDSGSFTFNLAHGIGGIKTGGLIRMMGAPGLGKTSLANRIIASGMAKGMSAFYIDTEGGLNLNILKDTLEDYGINPEDNLMFRYAEATNLRNVNKSSKPVMTLQRLLPMVEAWILDTDISPNGAVVVFDSLDFLVPEELVDTEVDKPTIALIARYMKNWLRKFSGTIRGTNSLVITVSQVSANIAPHAYETESFSGGNALKHTSMIDIRLKDVGQVKSGEELIGRNVKGIITKSKQGRSWRAFQYAIRYDVGPDRVGEIITVASALKIITGTSWITLGEQQFHGKEALREYLMNNIDARNNLEQTILQKVTITNDTEIVPEVSDEEKSELDEQEKRHTD